MHTYIRRFEFDYDYIHKHKQKGCTLYDVDGKEYLDMAAGIATCCLGHSNQQLKLAVTEQMEKVHHVSNIYIYIYI